MAVDVPAFTQIDLRKIPWQIQADRLIRNLDYDLGVHELLCSGSLGSAKSLFGAHQAIKHVVRNSGSVVCLGRLSMPDLKDTIFQTVLDHMEGDFIEGEDYETNMTKASIKFANGSKIISRSWGDKKFKKARSIKLSMLLIEELTENDSNYWPFYQEFKNRVGRIPGIKQNIVISLTNPDSPVHPAYNRFFVDDNRLRHVVHSRTEDNPFLPATYIENLKTEMTKEEVERFIYGKWIEIYREQVYYNYDRDRNYSKTPYSWNRFLPLDIMFDFNIGGPNKPMSAVIGQVINGHFHAVKSFVVQGARTLDICESIADSGILEKGFSTIRIFGDQTGEHRDTRSVFNDYQIIEKFFANQKASQRVMLQLPKKNPPIRKRHNIVNSKFLNASNEVLFTCYDETIDEGLRLTEFAKGSVLIENDNFYAQHLTTAIGYWISFVHNDTRIPHFKMYQGR